MHLTFREFGQALDVLELRQTVAAPLATGEVRVRILASPINPADVNFIQGTYGVRPVLPATPGMEGCGEVVESRDHGLVAGDRVLFLKRAALWAETVVAPADILLKLPSDIDPMQAAMLRVNPLTAFRMLHDFVTLPPGSWVVLNAANSGVGRCVSQLCRHFGWRAINLVRRPELEQELLCGGAERVFVDNEEAVEKVRALTGEAGAMLALNAVGGDSALRLMNMLAPGGCHVTYGAMGRQALKVPNGLLIFRTLSVHGFWVTKWMEEAVPPEPQATIMFLSDLVRTGKLHQAVDSSYSLPDFHAALRRATATGRDGKVLFTPQAGGRL